MKDDKFQQLVNLYLDKEISPADLHQLQQEIASTPGRLDTFQSYVRLHAAEKALLGDEPDSDCPLQRVRTPWDSLREENGATLRFLTSSASAVFAMLAAFGIYLGWTITNDTKTKPVTGEIPILDLPETTQGGIINANSMTGKEVGESRCVVISVIQPRNQNDHAEGFVRRRFKVTSYQSTQPEPTAGPQRRMFHVAFPNEAMTSQIIDEQQLQPVDIQNNLSLEDALQSGGLIEVSLPADFIQAQPE